MLKFSFCPKCGKDVKQKNGIIKCMFCGNTTYLHSFPTGSVFIVNKDKVMLAKRAEAPFKNYWDVLGGFLHFGEHPKDGAIRELKEETGLNIKIIHLLGIYMDKYIFQKETLPTLNTVYIGEIKSGTPNPTDDVSELKWFDIKSPPKKIAFSMVSKALKDLKKWYENS